MSIINVAAAIIQHEGRIYAARRSAGPFEGGWEFPGGKLEEGESAEQALKREVREELGVELSTIWYLDSVEHDYPDFHLHMDCFVCELAPGSVLVDEEHLEGRWLAREDLLTVDWLPADRNLVARMGAMWDAIFDPSHL